MMNFMKLFLPSSMELRENNPLDKSYSMTSAVEPCIRSLKKNIALGANSIVVKLRGMDGKSVCFERIKFSRGWIHFGPVFIMIHTN